MFSNLEDVPTWLQTQTPQQECDQSFLVIGENASNLARKWLLIGAFQQIKSVFVFTNEPQSYTHVFGKTPSKVLVTEATSAKFFDFEQALSQWSDFQNREVLSSFEVQQLNIILKKFVK